MNNNVVDKNRVEVASLHVYVFSWNSHYFKVTQKSSPSLCFLQPGVSWCFPSHCLLPTSTKLLPTSPNLLPT